MLAANAHIPESHVIGVTHLRRLLFFLLDDYQDELVRKGAIPEAARIGIQFGGPDDAKLDRLVIGEQDLALDSLARIDLVGSLTERFGLDRTGVEDYLLVRRKLSDWIELIDWHFNQQQQDTVLRFQTSGSTGRPTAVEHTLTDLISEVQAIQSGPLGSVEMSGRVWSQVSPIHIYGFLWTVLLPSMSGATVHDLPPGAGSRMGREAATGDLVIATPFLWEQLGRQDLSLAPGVLGISSGGPTGPATWKAANKLGLGGLVEVYGSSETGGLGWRTDPHQGYQIADDIEKKADRLWRISNPSRPLLAPDRLKWIGERSFHVLGRKDKVVQVAGTNVNLSELRNVILTETGAADAAVRLDGNRLKAFIATGHGSQLGIEEKLHKTLSKFRAVERPASISWGIDLPRTPQGKLADW